MKLTTLLGRVSVLIPFAMAIYLSYEEPILKLPFMEEPLSGWVYFMIYLLWVVLWLFFSPARKACDEGVFLLLFNLYPLLMLGDLVLMQYAEAVSVLLLVLSLVLPLGYLILLYLPVWMRKKNARKPKHPGLLFHRMFIMLSGILLIVPLLLSLLVFRMSPPTVAPEETTPPESAMPGEPEPGIPEFYANFSQKKWDGMTQKARVTLLKQIMTDVTSRLGVPEVNQLLATTLEREQYGYYEPENKSIIMNVDVFEKISFETIVRTVLHATYHHYQYYVIEKIDWSDAVTSTAYYDTVRAWKENVESDIPIHDQDGYATQPLEADALAFVESEWAFLEALTASSR